jgi:hypothetical protein
MPDRFLSFSLLLNAGNVCHNSQLPNKLQNIKHAELLSFLLLCMASESLSRTLREEHTPWVFENRMLRRILEPKRDEATEDWRRLYNEELCDLCSSSNIMQVIK